MKLFILICLGFLLYTAPAQASYWKKCDVEAEVVNVTEDSLDIAIISARVTEGHDAKGSECLEMGDVYNMDRKNRNIKLGDSLSLEYDYYNGMGEEGVVEGAMWKLRSHFSHQK